MTYPGIYGMLDRYISSVLVIKRTSAAEFCHVSSALARRASGSPPVSVTTQYLLHRWRTRCWPNAGYTPSMSRRAVHVWERVEPTERCRGISEAPGTNELCVEWNNLAPPAHTTCCRTKPRRWKGVVQVAMCGTGSHVWDRTLTQVQSYIPRRSSKRHEEANQHPRNNVSEITLLAMTWRKCSVTCLHGRLRRPGFVGQHARP